jgi:hypothetical protein
VGLDNASIKFACAAKSLGVDFSNTVMLGRQRLLPNANTVQEVFAIHGIKRQPTEFLEANKWGEEFFTLLGAREINSMDYSSYEGASILHDLNSPIPSDLTQRFSVVYDGGTLEHIFNLRQAFKNCMEMVQVGGHFLQVSIANNYMGHGFWQFSPELLFRVFSPANGYEIRIVLLHEVVSQNVWYLVSDPDQVRQRVTLCNSNPTYILTIAKRIANCEIFSQPTLQSDYSAAWDRISRLRSQPPPKPGLQKQAPHKVSQKSRLQRYVGKSMEKPLKAISHRVLALKTTLVKASPFQRVYYRRIPEYKLLRGVLE